VALSIESALQLKFELNTGFYFLLSFISTVVYYSKAYIKTETIDEPFNERSRWYSANKSFISKSQLLFEVFISVYLVTFLFQNFTHLKHLFLYEYGLLIGFPLLAITYYGIENKWLPSIHLRKIGWLKPFVIGFIWAGLTIVYPQLYTLIKSGQHFILTDIQVVYFLQSFIFISILCIMFDIKDYAMDYNHQLKTFVVNIGLRKTINFIIVPLIFLGLIIQLYFCSLTNYDTFQTLLNCAPFLLLVLVAYTLHTPKSIFYYLIIIDGLMLVKATLGILSTL
jgi:hypothetical protein